MLLWSLLGETTGSLLLGLLSLSLAQRRSPTAGTASCIPYLRCCDKPALVPWYQLESLKFPLQVEPAYSLCRSHCSSHHACPTRAHRGRCFPKAGVMGANTMKSKWKLCPSLPGIPHSTAGEKKKKTRNPGARISLLLFFLAVRHYSHLWIHTQMFSNNN